MMRSTFAPLMLLLASTVSIADESTIGYTLVAAPDHAASILDRGSPGFDAAGNACMRDGARITLLPRGGAPRTLDFAAAAVQAIDRDLFAGGKWDQSFDKSLMVDTAIEFDAAGRAYTLVVPRYGNMKSAALLWSADGCATWHALALAGINATMEKPDSFNDHAGPPTILSYENYGGKSGRRLWLERFAAAGEEVRRQGGPVLVAGDSLLTANHSGGGNSSATMRDRIVVVYPVLTPGAGTLSVAREFDLATGGWTGPAQPIGRSTTEKSSDNHDLPAIARLPNGRLLVVIGSHHARLQVAESKAPGTIAGGWGDPVPLGNPAMGAQYGQYSYASLNVAKDGTINIVARAEGRQGYYDLVQLRRPAGTLSWNWPDGTPHRTIATPNRHAYAAWRQRVSAAPDGTLYLFFGYFPNRLTREEAATLKLDPARATECTQSDGRCWYGDSPVLDTRTLVSHDAGATWR